MVSEKKVTGCSHCTGLFIILLITWAQPTKFRINLLQAERQSLYRMMVKHFIASNSGIS